MLETIQSKDLFEAQNQVENRVTELIRYVVIEAVKHGHELSTYKFCKTMNELERIKGQKNRMIERINQSGNDELAHLVKEILQADLLVEGKEKKA